MADQTDRIYENILGIVADGDLGPSAKIDEISDLLNSEQTGEDSVNITAAEYESLKEDADTLGKLERAGVDNWEWYGEALNHPEEFE